MSEESINRHGGKKKRLSQRSNLRGTKGAALIVWETRLDRDDDESYDDLAMSPESLEGWCHGVLGGGREASECLAHVFAVLMDSLEEGTEVTRMSKGAVRVKNTLCEGVELMYRRSEAYRLGFELYTLSVLGHVQQKTSQ